MSPCMSGCLFLTDRGVVKEGLFYFLLRFPFFFLLIFLFLCSTAVFHVALKVSVLVSRVSTFEWKRRRVCEVWSSSIPKGGAGFAFHTPPALLRDVPRGVSVGWQAVSRRESPHGEGRVRRREQCCADLTSCHAGFKARPTISPQPRPVGPRLYCNRRGILLKLHAKVSLNMVIEVLIDQLITSCAE